MKHVRFGTVVLATLLAAGCEPDPGENPYNEAVSEAGPAAAADSTPYTDDVSVDTPAAPVVVQP